MQNQIILIATFRVPKLTLQTPKLWLVGVPTDRDARHACLRFFSFHCSPFIFACISFHLYFFLFLFFLLAFLFKRIKINEKQNKFKTSKKTRKIAKKKLMKKSEIQKHQKIHNRKTTSLQKKTSQKIQKTGSNKWCFFVRNVTRNRAAIEAKKNCQKKIPIKKNVNPGLRPSGFTCNTIIGKSITVSVAVFAGKGRFLFWNTKNRS